MHNVNTEYADGLAEESVNITYITRTKNIRELSILARTLAPT